jgi:ubiquinone/menaquinone biosynthesis C-methylase UbiE
LRSFRASGLVLEIGSGAGTDHAELAKTADSTVAVDLAHHGAMLTQTRLRLENRPGSATVADAERLPFRDHTFDCVYSFGVIHHTDHPERIADEMFRTMKTGGRFLVAVYNRHSLFTFKKVIEFIVRGRIFRESWSHFFGQIEAGAEELAVRPTIHLYSRKQAEKLFSKFSDVTTELVHVGADLPLAQDFFGRHFGWYVVIRGVKRGAA